MPEHEMEPTPVDNNGSLSGSTLAAVTAIIITLTTALTFLTYAGSDITQLVSFLGFIPNVILSIVLLRKQSTIEGKVEKVERNTNGNLTALIEKINHVPTTPDVVQPVERPYGSRDGITGR
jgi:hypothetical protein